MSHHGLPDWFVFWDSVITSKFWSSLCCYLSLKQTTIQSSSSTGFGRYYATNRCRYRLMHPGFLTRLSTTETQSLSSSFGPRGTTFRLGYVYTPLSRLRSPSMRLLWGYWIKISWLHVEKTFSTGLTTNPFPPDFWDYVHGYGHQPEGLIVSLTYYDLLKIWQISLRRTCEVLSIDLATS